MKKTILMATLVFLFGAGVHPVAADTEVVQDITWTFTLSGGKATITGMSDCDGTVVVPDRLGGCPVAALGPNSMCVKNFTRVFLPATLNTIGDDAFICCGSVEYIEIPSSVRTIGKSAFQSCSKLRKIVIPEGITTLRFNTFMDCSNLELLVLPSTLNTFDNSFYWQGIFLNCTKALIVAYGSPNIAGIDDSNLSMAQAFRCPRNLSSAWITKMGISKFAGYCEGYFDCSASIVSSSIRENDPTIMDVVYKVTSKKSKVKVRVLAFEDGERSFAKVVRPETFVTDTNGVETACNVGDNVTPNVEHTISWRVSSDWTTKLAKVKFEVLASEGELLPLELMTIPASDQYGKMKISWNAISSGQCFDALLWLYADKTAGLTCTSGVLRNGSTQLASGAGISAENAMTYIYGKMGYSRLIGAPLTYANSETRLGLSPSGARQYAYKIVEE